MRTRSAGFTLIELMVVVGIIGMLATVALPAFQRYQLRSRAAERDLFIAAIHRSVETYHVALNRFPQDFGAWSVMWCGPNPPAPPGPVKHPFQRAIGDWHHLAAIPEGSLYYQYEVLANAVAGWRSHTITVNGDVDGDGVQSTLQRQYTFSAAGYAMNEFSWGGPY
jgi:prepilin-type N-terminal cleavage/methylation domain-containing protein